MSTALDPNSTTVEVWIEAPNPDRQLRPGITVTAAIVAQTLNNSIAIPAAALQKTPQGQNVVMVVRDNHARQVEVETGVQQGDRLQITRGLKGGETVIVNGAYALPDNTQVKIAQPDAAEGTAE